jgi:hypothetical protein
MTTDDVNPSRTALSIAASRRMQGTCAWARSMIVRVAEAERNPSTVTRSSLGGGPS